MGWLECITDSKDMSWCNLRELVLEQEALCAEFHGGHKELDMTELNRCSK